MDRYHPIGARPYSGGLTYSSNWNTDISPWQGEHGLPAGTGDIATQISFWDQLDYVGIDCYAPIYDVPDPTLDDLVAGWTDTPTDLTAAAVTDGLSLVAYFQSIAARVGIPLLFRKLAMKAQRTRPANRAAAGAMPSIR